MADYPVINALSKEWDEIAQLTSENPLVRPLTRVSWDRCREYHVDPKEPTIVILSDEDLSLKRRTNSDLLRASVPYMRHLSALYQEVPHVVALADKDAWIIEIVGNTDDIGGRDAGICVGASWQEQHIGNNGAGTSLALQQPVLVYGTEHYSQPYHSCACIGIPIRDASGLIVGALDLSIPVRFALGGNFAVLQACVCMIQEQFIVQAPPLTLPEMVDEAIKMIEKSGANHRRKEHDDNSQAMSQLESLHLMGELAAGVGHEVRNPLTTVRGFLQFYKLRPEFVRHEATFDLMIEELDRASSIITEFLALGKHGDTREYEKANLNTIIKALSPLINAEAIKLGCDLELELDYIPEVSLNESQIRQVILNLAKNAFDAMPAGGKLSIRTYSATPTTVTLEVTDQGMGIPNTMISKLGTPFATTKEKGTGLGLAICYDIISRHKGDVRVSTGNAGTSFFIDLPVAVISSLAGSDG